MAKFYFKATDKNGNVLKRYMEAASEEEVIKIINAQNMIPIEIEESKAFSLKSMALTFSKISKSELILFSTQLATMLKAGLPITRALRAIVSQVSNRKFAAALDDIRDSIEKGRAFYNALSMYPQYFDEVYVATVRIGEISGNLPEILFKLAEHIEKDEEVKQKIKSATLYPKIVLAAILTAVIVLITFVIPRFADLYRSFRTELPLPTRILIKISTFFTSNWYILLLIFIGLISLFIYLTKTAAGKKVYHPFLLKLPIIGELVKKMIMVRFSRFFSLLFSSGIIITDILELLKNVLGNVIFIKQMDEIKKDIIAGVSFEQAVSKTGFFTHLVQEMIAIGEETGSLDEMLKKVADFYERDLDYTIKKFMTLLEPIMLVIIFGMVLFLALSVFLPMWDMVKFVKG